MAPARPRVKNIPQNLKPYFLALFRPAKHWNETEGAHDLPARQLLFLREQFEAGSYRLAGPVTDGGEFAAMAIIEAKNIEDARRKANRDPAVTSGHLKADVHPILTPALDAVNVEYSRSSEEESP